MFKSVYHGACIYFSPFSGFLECVFTLLRGKHLRGLFNGCQLVSIAPVFDKSPSAEHPPQEGRFPGLSLPSHQLLIPFPLPLLLLHKNIHALPLFPTQTSLVRLVHFRSTFHSIACTHGLETAEQGSLWDISWSQGPEALSCCLAPTVGTLPSKMYVSACFTFNI